MNEWMKFALVSHVKIKSLFISGNLGQLSNLCCCLWLIFSLFNCSFSCVDKVTSGTLIFVSVIAIVSAPVEKETTQVDDHVKIMLISKWIN